MLTLCLDSSHYCLCFSVCEQAMEAWKRYIRRDDSHLVDLFVGQLKSTLRCAECNHESVTFEPFWDLSLGIPARSGEVSLTECLDSFTKEETLDGDEMPVITVELLSLSITREADSE